MPSARVRRRRSAVALVALLLLIALLWWSLPLRGDPTGAAPSELVPLSSLPTQQQHAAVRGPDPATATTRTPRLIDTPREQIDGFALSERRMQPIAQGDRPYQGGEVPDFPFGLVDGEGVRMFEAPWDPEQPYDHPIAQAQYALAAIEAYRISGEQRHLDIALANAGRIADNHAEIDGAWYFPYAFDFDLYRNGVGVFEAPWSSGMATGQALSVFARLAEITGDEAWVQAADATFAAFEQAPDGEGMFVSFVDDDGLLWLEEYPRYPVMTSERVLNGHMWSMFGLWDYWMLHEQNQPEAEELWRGALRTLEEVAMPTFRDEDWYSRYSVWQHRTATTYHHHHQDQFLLVHRMSGDPVWVERARVLRSDHPYYKIDGGTARLTPELGTAYRTDDAGTHVNDRTMEVLDTRPVELEETVDVAFDRRARIPDGPVVLRVSEGELEGWWVAEEPGVAWSLTILEEHRYAPAVWVGVTGDAEVEVFAVDDLGQVVQNRTVELTPGEPVRSPRSAIVAGLASWEVELPDGSRWWLPEQEAVVLLAEPERETS